MSAHGADIIMPDLSRPAVYADGSVVVTNALTAHSLYATQLYAASSIVGVTDMSITELSGFRVVGSDFNTDVPTSFDPDTQQGVILSGVGVSGTSWASFYGDLQIGTNLHIGGSSTFVGAISAHGDVGIDGSLYTQGITGGDVLFDTVSTGNIITYKYGLDAGYLNKGDECYQIGTFAGRDNAGGGCYQIGSSAGRNNEGNECYQIGSYAGRDSEGDECYQIGSYAGWNNGGYKCYQIGSYAGMSNDGYRCYQFGEYAGYQNEGYRCYQFGEYAGYLNKGDECYQIGVQSGDHNAGDGCYQIGIQSGDHNAGDRCYQIGSYAGRYNTGDYAIQIGTFAGMSNAYDYSICIDNYDNIALASMKAGEYDSKNDALFLSGGQVYVGRTSSFAVSNDYNVFLRGDVLATNNMMVSNSISANTSIFGEVTVDGDLYSTLISADKIRLRGYHLYGEPDPMFEDALFYAYVNYLNYTIINSPYAGIFVQHEKINMHFGNYTTGKFGTIGDSGVYGPNSVFYGSDSTYARTVTIIGETNSLDVLGNTVLYGNTETINLSTTSLSANTSIFGEVTGGFSEFKSDGTLWMRGSATVWRDEVRDALDIKQNGNNIFTNIDAGVVEITTSADLGDYMYCNIQLNHDRKLDSNISPHIHWFQTEAAIPNLLLQYRWIPVGEDTLPAWTYYPLTAVGKTYTSGTLHQLQEGATIAPPANTNVSDIIQFKIFRDNANASGQFAGADTYTASVSVLSFDIHIECDQIGSNQVYIK